MTPAIETHILTCSAILASLLISAGCSPEPEMDPAVSIAEEKVRELLRDPESARFKNISRHGDVVCGEVNSKNGFGGYAGFSQFAYEVTSGEAFVDDEDDIAPLAEMKCDLARTMHETREE